MRQIGTIEDEKLAHLFSDFLFAQEIKTQVEQDEDAWAVWVRDEDQLEESRSLLAEFEANPGDEKYRSAAQEASELRRNEAQRATRRSNQTVDVRRDVWSQPTTRRSPLTMVLGIACIAVAIFTGVGQYRHKPIMRSLLFADPVHELQPTAGINGSSWSDFRQDTWRDVKNGQVWRTITPIFVHFGVAHIAFNLIWLFSLGAMIESRRSTAILALVVLASALGGNIGQAIVTGPTFGGMSGVVYGLLGFIWIRMHLAPGEGLVVARDNVIIMMIWMILGFVGVLKAAFGVDVANAAHLCGLLAGILVAIALPVGAAKEKLTSL